jgi:hypothetical protein
MTDIAAAMESAVATPNIGMLYLCAQQNQLRNYFTFGEWPQAFVVITIRRLWAMSKRGRLFL